MIHDDIKTAAKYILILSGGAIIVSLILMLYVFYERALVIYSNF